jgi:hypothetical protein
LIAAGILLVSLAVPVLLRALRRGRLHLRGPRGRVDRHRQPAWFWSSIAATGLTALGGLIMVAFGLFQSFG